MINGFNYKYKQTHFKTIASHLRGFEIDQTKDYQEIS